MRRIGILHLAGVLVIVPLACAQQATSRTEQMEQIRTDKQARLWPEHTPGLVKRLNNYAERGLLEGARSGKGANGPQHRPRRHAVGEWYVVRGRLPSN